MRKAIRSMFFAAVAVLTVVSPPRIATAQGAVQQGVSMRYTMSDGSVVVGTQVAEDAATVTIQTAIGTIRVQRANIASVQPAGAAVAQPAVPAPVPAPVPMPAGAYPTYAYPYAPPAAPPRSRGQGLMIAGSIVFGVPYFITLWIAALASLVDGNAGWGYVPVFGPVAWASNCRSTSSFGDPCAGIMGYAIFDTLVQAAGAAMLIAGIVQSGSSDGARRDSTGPRFALAPSVGPGQAGVTLFGRF